MDSSRDLQRPHPAGFRCARFAVSFRAFGTFPSTMGSRPGCQLAATDHFSVIQALSKARQPTNGLNLPLAF